MSSRSLGSSSTTRTAVGTRYLPKRGTPEGRCLGQIRIGVSVLVYNILNGLVAKDVCSPCAGRMEPTGPQSPQLTNVFPPGVVDAGTRGVWVAWVASGAGVCPQAPPLRGGAAARGRLPLAAGR